MTAGDAESPDPAVAARGLVRAADRAVLATALAGAEAWPYGSLVLTACAQDASPLLLISTLAEHTRNIAGDPRVSLLFDGTAGLDDPLTGARVTLLGHAERCDDVDARARYLARHPSAEGYAAFADFALYRVAIVRAHLVAGFGRIHWIDGAELLCDTADSAALAAAEPDIVAHMNADHADAINLYARVLLGRDGDGWILTGIDPEGCDLRRGGAVARLDFPEPVHDAGGARKVLVALVQAARQRQGAAAPEVA
jgi:putative heme iron utilization protein